MKHTRDFIKWKYQADDFEIRKLDYEFISQYEYTYQYIEETGLLADVPATLERYFDYEAFAHDLFLEGYTEVDGYVFANY